MTKQGRTIATGSMNESDLYVMNIEVVLPKQQLLITQKIRDVNDWHRAMGHPGKERIGLLFGDTALEIKKTGELLPCAECAAA